MRNISSSVPHQGKGLTCWNHVIAKVCVRLIFNVLGMKYEDTPKCDEFYDHRELTIDDPDILEVAMEECNPEKNGYLKFLLTSFFTRFLYSVSPEPLWMWPSISRGNPELCRRTFI